jgi:hypothetical protein
MRFRLVASLVALLSLPVLMALQCQPTTRIVFTSPAGPVNTFSFTISFDLVGSFAATPPQVMLNNQTLIVSGGPTSFTASQSGGPTVNPGPPLQNQNLLIVRATRADNTPLIAAHTFDYAPAKASLFKIDDLADCPVSGPLAHERVGDYCMQNGLARFVVQDVTAPANPSDPTPRDLYSVGAFGGNLIDAVLVADPTTDNFLEFQAMLNIETVTNNQTISIINDGQDGTPAILRACGPDDLLDFVNPSSLLISAGITPFGCSPATRNCVDDNDQAVEACTTYTLAPGNQHVTVATEVTNNEAVPLSMLVGDWTNVAGEVDGWFKPNPGIGEAVFNPTTGGLSWFAETPIQSNRFEYGYVPVGTVPAFPQGPGSYVTVSGVTVVLHDMNALIALAGLAPSPFVVAPGGSRTFTRHVLVGDGRGNAAQELAHVVNGQNTGTVQGCVTVGGAPAPNAKVSIYTLNTGPPVSLNQAIAHFVTNASGCYSGKVEVAGSGTVNYGAIAGKDGARYVGGGATPPITQFNLFPAGDSETINFAMPNNGTLTVNVTDETGNPVPARVTVVGFDPSAEATVAGASVPGIGTATLGRLNDVNDAKPFGIVAFQHTGADGVAQLKVENGVQVHVFVSRGTEYSTWSTVPTGSISFAPGTAQTLNAKISRVLDTQDFISSDFHVHGIASPDAQVNDATRANEFAGEGVENLVATDHHVHHDYKPAMAAAGLASWVTSTVGEEITSFDYGHFNGYPFEIDPSVPSGGSTDWALAAPPGKDFPSYGAYNLAPAGIFQLATTQPEAKPSTTLQVNHIDSHFAPLQINTALVPPQDNLTAAQRLQLRIDPANPPLGQLFYPFPALELWNGMNRGHQGEFLNQRIGIWTNLLDQGIRTTAISDTDTHEYNNLRAAGARTWTATSAGNDTPTAFDEDEMAASVEAGRAVGGQGVYVQTRLLATDGSGAVADLTYGGSNTVSSSNGEVTLEIHVQSPRWAPWDRIEIYSNAGGNVSAIPVTPAQPYLYTAAPLQALVEGDCNPATTGDGDFDISVVNVVPSVPGAERLDATVTRTFSGLSATTWFAVVVKGSDGSCGPMFPIYPHSLATAGNTTLANLVDGNVGQQGTMALGVANALYYEP